MSRDVRARGGPRRPPLSVAQVLTWASAHPRRTGAWPTRGTRTRGSEPPRPLTGCAGRLTWAR
jgi:hypothetical protein